MLIAPPPAVGAVPRRAVVRLLAVLAAGAGCLDVFCVVELGGLFSSVITGNLIQLGRGIAKPDWAMAFAATVAVGAYAVGVAVATLALRGRQTGWRRRTCAVGCVESLLLVAVAVGWSATEGRPTTGQAVVLLALASTAMGVQSAVTLSSGVRGASTTYLTGTLTTYVWTAIAHPHQLRAATPSAGRLLALLVGAIVGAVMLRFAPLWTPVLPTILVAGTFMMAGWLVAADRARL